MIYKVGWYEINTQKGTFEHAESCLNRGSFEIKDNKIVNVKGCIKLPMDVWEKLEELGYHVALLDKAEVRY